jgi:hypothetical protein
MPRLLRGGRLGGAAQAGEIVGELVGELWAGACGIAIVRHGVVQRAATATAMAMRTRHGFRQLPAPDFRPPTFGAWTHAETPFARSFVVSVSGYFRVSVRTLSRSIVVCYDGLTG